MSAAVTTDGAERRRRKLVDARLQGRLLAILLLLEFAVVVAALALLYRHAGASIDASIYRVHLSGMPTLLELLLPGVALAVLALLAVNCAAVYAIERQWRAQVRGIVGEFLDLAQRCAVLDFRADPPAPHEHPALHEMRAWRSELRARHAKVLLAVAALDPGVAPTNRQALARQREAVAAIEEALDG